MKLRDKTPYPVVYFLAGSLPLEGMLHLRQLSLLLMVYHLAENVINMHSKQVLLMDSLSARSWIHAIHDTCEQFMRFSSLSSPHRISQSLDGNPYKAQAASV